MKRTYLQLEFFFLFFKKKKPTLINSERELPEQSYNINNTKTTRLQIFPIRDFYPSVTLIVENPQAREQLLQTIQRILYFFVVIPRFLFRLVVHNHVLFLQTSKQIGRFANNFFNRL